MNQPNNIARLSGLVLALVGLMIGSIVPGYCLDLPFSGPVAKTLLTSPSWFPTGNLDTARANHTATQLQNGKVLVVGGRGSDPNITPDPELYDPVTGLWSVTGALNKPRRGGHTATLLPDGKVLVVAGDASDSPPPYFGGTAELYDPSTGTWSLTGSLNVTRCCHTATLLQNGKVLVAGGFNLDTVKSAELYDPASGEWSFTGSLNVARYWHTATLLQDGRVLIAGGSNDGDLASTLSDAELYDPAAGTWSTTGNLNTAVVLHTAMLLPTGKVLVVGGYLPTFPQGYAAPISLSSAELYDPAAGTWSNTGNLNAGRDSHTATLLPDGEVLVVGGEAWHGQYPGLQVETLGGAESYDPNIGVWTITSSLNTARSRHTATLLPDGRVLVAGGNVVGPFTNIVLDSAELYDPQMQTAVEYYYAAWNFYFETSFPDEIAALDGGAFGGAWKRTGQTFHVWPQSNASAVPVCRFFLTAFAPKSSHFYTASASECASLKLNPGWQYESIAFYIQIPAGYGTGNGFCPQGTDALYRLYNNGMDGAPNHRYTTSLATFNTMLAQGWVFEGEANTKIFACVPQ